MSLTRPVEIERELQRQIAAASASRSKASLFNLVIFRRCFRPDPSAEALAYLLGKRPARILLVESGYNGSSEAGVSARCHPDPKNAELCFQEILIQVGDDGIGREPGFWSPLLIRDIPVFLWWLEPLQPFPELLEQAESFADRFLIHTGLGSADDPLTLYRRLASHQAAAGVPVSDFAWHRTLPLRVGAARLFAPAAVREALSRIEAVRLRGGAPAEGLLLFLWLASRLNWRLLGWNHLQSKKPAELDVLTATFRDSTGQEVSLEHQSPGALEGGFSVQFVLHGSPSLELSCSGEGCATLPGKDGELQRLRLAIPSPGEILLREVDSPRTDPLFPAALRVLLEERRA